MDDCEECTELKSPPKLRRLPGDKLAAMSSEIGTKRMRLLHLDPAPSKFGESKVASPQSLLDFALPICASPQWHLPALSEQDDEKAAAQGPAKQLTIRISDRLYARLQYPVAYHIWSRGSVNVICKSAACAASQSAHIIVEETPSAYLLNPLKPAEFCSRCCGMAVPTY